MLALPGLKALRINLLQQCFRAGIIGLVLQGSASGLLRGSEARARQFFLSRVHATRVLFGSFHDLAERPEPFLLWVCLQSTAQDPFRLSGSLRFEVSLNSRDRF